NRHRPSMTTDSDHRSVNVDVVPPNQATTVRVAPVPRARTFAAATRLQRPRTRHPPARRARVPAYAARTAGPGTRRRENAARLHHAPALPLWARPAAGRPGSARASPPAARRHASGQAPTADPNAADADTPRM